MVLVYGVVSIPTDARAVTYQYDDLGRITSIDHGNGNTVAYTYDAMGNRLTETVVGTAEPDTTVLLSVTPVADELPGDPSTPALSVSNVGGGILSWTATVTLGDAWLSITSGSTGTVGGLIALQAAANPDTLSRTGIIRIQAPDANNGTIDVVLRQVGSGQASSSPDLMGADHLCLHQNFPNPFNPSTRIAFYLPTRQRVRLDIYDLSGRLINRLIGDVVLERGRHEAVWRGCDRSGRRAASGTYFYRLQAGSDLLTRRMVLLK